MASPLASLMRARVGREFEFCGYRVSRASTEEECLAAFRLRHRVFVEEGFLNPSYYPDGLFRDRFDDASVQVLVRDPLGELVATTRFVRSTPIGFPTENLFDFRHPPIDRRRLGEYGRLAIIRDHRGGHRAPMLAMLKAVFECMIENATTHVYAFLSPKLADSYAQLGCVSMPLAELPPSADTLAKRAPMRGYFETQKVKPVLFNLREMMEEVGVPIDRDDLRFVREE